MTADIRYKVLKAEETIGKRSVMRLEINVHDDRKIVEIWLSHSEQADAALREQLRPIYQEYNGKKYTVAVFQSGTEDLYEQTHQLLLYNRNRAAELEVKQQAPVME